MRPARGLAAGDHVDRAAARGEGAAWRAAGSWPRPALLGCGEAPAGRLRLIRSRFSLVESDVEFDLAVRGGLVVTEDGAAVCDIGIKDGTIAAMAIELPQRARRE